MADKGDYIFICTNRRGRDGRPACESAKKGPPDNEIKIPRSKVPDLRKLPKCPECGVQALIGPTNAKKKAPIPLIAGVVGALLVLGLIIWLIVGNSSPPPDMSGPSSIAFGEVSLGLEETRTITIRNKGEGLLKVSKIEIESEVFVCQEGAFELEKGDRKSLVVTFLPNKEGDFQGKLIVHSNHPGAPKAEIKLTGKGASIDYVSEWNEIIENSKILKPSTP